MLTKIVTDQDGWKSISYDLSTLTDEEVDFAKAMWIKGWNSFMEILPNITPNDLLVDEKFPYNREYTEDKEPLVRYFTKGLDNFNKVKSNN